MRLSDLPPELRERARALRREGEAQSRAAFLAYCLKGGLPAPVPEYRFCERMWRFDFAFEPGGAKLALEIEGASFGTGKPCPTCGQRKAGAHTRGGHFASDLAKYAEAAALGWRLVRVVPDDLYEPRTLALLRRALNRA